MIEKIKKSGLPLGFWIGTVALVILLIAASVWVFWPKQQVLFANLAPEDASQITTQLDKHKIPYKLADGGATILTAPDLIAKARLQVFSQEVTLKSGVGLELFSGNDLGMTEFSQHVNFVRALQGELTRTLLAIEGVESARVHIAMPERTTRRSQGNNTKVAITLNAKQAVTPETVRGIQRLAAAAIPGVSQSDVVILDGKGNLLTSSVAPSANSKETGSQFTGQLEQKASIESYLEKKAKKLLVSIAPPPAKVEALVDVTLTEQQRQITREEIIPSGKMNGLPIGVLQKGRFHKENTSEAVNNTSSEDEGVLASKPASSSSQDDFEFISGRQVEHIENPIGAVERINLSVVITGNLPANAEVALRQTLSRALGLNSKRGDDVAILIMPELIPATTPKAPAEDLSTLTNESANSVFASSPQQSSKTDSMLVYISLAAGALLLLVTGVIFMVVRRAPSRDPEALADELRLLLQDDPKRTA